MKTELNTIIDIQDHLDSVILLKKDLQKLTDEVTELEEQKKKAEAAFNAVVEREKEHERKIRKNEQEIEDFKGKIAKSKQKLNEVKTNKEYKAILTEVEKFESSINEIEEVILVYMEAMEGVKKETETARGEFKLREKEFNDQRDGYTTRINKKKSELESLAAKVEELKKSLPQETLLLLEKLIGRKGDKPVARVIDGICQGCFQTIPPQDFIELKLATKIATCNNCQRFIYYLKE